MITILALLLFVLGLFFNALILNLVAKKFKAQNTTFKNALKILLFEWLAANLIGLKEGLMWVSQNWSADWNKEMIEGLIQNELPDNDLSQTYHGRVLLN